MNVNPRHVKDRSDQSDRRHPIRAQLDLLQPAQPHRTLEPLGRGSRIDSDQFGVQRLLKLSMWLTGSNRQQRVHHSERDGDFLIPEDLREQASFARINQALGQGHANIRQHAVEQQAFTDQEPCPLRRDPQSHRNLARGLSLDLNSSLTPRNDPGRQPFFYRSRDCSFTRRGLALDSVPRHQEVKEFLPRQALQHRGARLAQGRHRTQNGQGTRSRRTGLVGPGLPTQVSRPTLERQRIVSEHGADFTVTAPWRVIFEHTVDSTLDH